MGVGTTEMPLLSSPPVAGVVLFDSDGTGSTVVSAGGKSDDDGPAELVAC